ncbi:MAG: MFS transporter, partial [Sphingomonadales bacterium]|nr:MFS transporter [Sphingomonadales bacterium]
IVGLSATLGMGFYLYFGHLSDRVGRKKPIVWGYVLTLAAMFPVFWLMGAHANPGLTTASERAPVVISGTNCIYSPFASEQSTNCGKLLGDLTALGVPYKVSEDTRKDARITVAGTELPMTAFAWSDKALRSKQLQALMGKAGYDLAKVKPTLTDSLIIGFALLVMMALSGATYGPVAALLSEMFPPRIRYSSMSIPYHIGTGYFGGFLPFISGYIVAKTGNPYNGLWYTWGVVLMALLVSVWGLKSGLPRDYGDDAT